MLYLRKWLFVFTLFATFPVAGLAAERMLPLQVQSMQQREYEVTKTSAFGSVMSMLQDLGYQVDSADIASGFITASSEMKRKTSFWDALGGVHSTGNTRATAFIEELQNGLTRIRLNFLSTKTKSGFYGQTGRQDKAILDAKAYQIAFDKIEDALFIRQAIDRSPVSPSQTAETTAQSAVTVAQPPTSTGAPSKPSGLPEGAVRLSGGAYLLPADTQSGFCIKAPPNYVGTGIKSRPAVTSGRPRCE